MVHFRSPLNVTMVAVYGSMRQCRGARGGGEEHFNNLPRKFTFDHVFRSPVLRTHSKHIREEISSKASASHHPHVKRFFCTTCLCDEIHACCYGQSSRPSFFKSCVHYSCTMSCVNGNVHIIYTVVEQICQTNSTANPPTLSTRNTRQTFTLQSSFHQLRRQKYTFECPITAVDGRPLFVQATKPTPEAR